MSRQVKWKAMCAIAFCLMALRPSGHAFAHSAEGIDHKHPPISAFAQLPHHHVAMSPDGKYVAYLKKTDELSSVFVFDIDDSDAAPTRIDIEDLAYGYLFWANDRRLLVPVTFESREKFSQRGQRFGLRATESRLVAMDPDGSNRTVLMPDYDADHLSTWRSQVIYELPCDPDHVLLSVPEFFGRTVWAYKVNVHTGKAAIHAVGNPNTVYWGVDPSGNIRLRMDVRKGTQYVYWRSKIPTSNLLAEQTMASALTETVDLYDPDEFDKEISDEEFESIEGAKGKGRKIGTQDHEWQLLDRREYGTDEWLKVFGVSDQPFEIFVRARRDGDLFGAHLFNLQSRQVVETLFEHPSVDVSGLVIDWETGLPIGARFLDDRQETSFWDPVFKRSQESVDRALGKEHTNEIFESSRGRVKQLIWSAGPKRPGTYYILNRHRKSLEPFVNSYADLSAEQLGDVQRVTYQTEDGFTIHGYLTFPHFGRQSNLPLVVLPHGGPATRDHRTFDFWAQFLANRGYLVFQPNFRGSTGYGRKFERAGDGEWGRAMQDDVTKGVEHLIAEGLANRDRICIVGASYGGYAALMGALRSPDLYKCAISFAGVTDLNFTIRSERGTIAQRYVKAIIGDRKKDAAKLKENSPLSRARDFEVPLLLIHGTSDRTVSYGQTKQLYQRLRDKKRKHRLVTFTGGDHHLSEYEHRYRFLREIEIFLKKHIGETN